VRDGFQIDALPFSWPGSGWRPGAGDAIGRFPVIIAPDAAALIYQHKLGAVDDQVHRRLLLGGLFVHHAQLQPVHGQLAHFLFRAGQEGPDSVAGAKTFAVFFQDGRSIKSGIAGEGNQPDGGAGRQGRLKLFQGGGHEQTLPGATGEYKIGHADLPAPIGQGDDPAIFVAQGEVGHIPINGEWLGRRGGEEEERENDERAEDEAAPDEGLNFWPGMAWGLD